MAGIAGAALNRIPLEGKTFGRLQVLEPVRALNEVLRYRCRCSCGQVIIVRGQNLRLGMTQSCGCLQRERTKETSLVHGKSRSRVHNIWTSMLQRCEDEKCRSYPLYGGRGITVCDEWHDFMRFYGDMGTPPLGMTLERKDNSGPYCKANCEWATRRRQANNRRSTTMLTFKGRTQSQADWAREIGVSPKILWQRLKRGWSLERALGNAEGF